MECLKLAVMPAITNWSIEGLGEISGLESDQKVTVIPPPENIPDLYHGETFILYIRLK